MTYYELLNDAIKYDEEKHAYSVYWLIKNGVVKGTDNVSRVNWGLVNFDEVQAMMERNELNLKIIKLYSIPLGNNKHILIFAQDEQSARGHCMNETGQLPSKIFDISSKMDEDFWFEETKQYKSLRRIRDETLMFPATAFIYEKG